MHSCLELQINSSKASLQRLNKSRGNSSRQKCIDINYTSCQIILSVIGLVYNFFSLTVSIMGRFDKVQAVDYVTIYRDASELYLFNVISLTRNGFFNLTKSYFSLKSNLSILCKS
jgi:hypothetical protein